MLQDLKMEKKSYDLYTPDDGSNTCNEGRNRWNGSDSYGDEEAPLIPSSRMSHIGRSQVTGNRVWQMIEFYSHLIDRAIHTHI